MTTHLPDDPQVGVHAPDHEPVIDTPDVATGDHRVAVSGGGATVPPAHAASGSPAGAPAASSRRWPLAAGLIVALLVTIGFACVPDDSNWLAHTFSFIGGASSFYTAVALIFLAFDDGDDSMAARFIRAQDAHTFRPFLATTLAASSLGIGICTAFGLGSADSLEAWLLGALASCVLLVYLGRTGRK